MPTRTAVFQGVKHGKKGRGQRHFFAVRNRCGVQNIDVSRSAENYHIIEPQKAYYYEIQGRIENAKCKVRKDSVRFIDTIITASPEFFKSRPPKEVEEYFRRAVDFLSVEVGKHNIFSAAVHMDERTPRIYLCFVPITQDNRLSAKEILGNRVKLTAWQDKLINEVTGEGNAEP